MSRIAGWIVGTWLGAHVVLIAGHVLLVFIYSLAIAPGLDNAAYTAFAERSGPWFSIAFGGPAFYAVGRLLLARLAPHGRAAALIVWGLYSATDLSIVLAVGATWTPLLIGQWIASQGIKLVAVLLATRAPAASGEAVPR